MKCEVLSCPNRTRFRTKGISFHRFPVIEDQRNLWKNAIGRKKMVIKPNSFICSVHFHPKDLVASSRCTTVTKEAVPALNLMKAKSVYLSNAQKNRKRRNGESGELIIRETQRLSKAKSKLSTCPEIGDLTVEVDSSPEESFAEQSMPICLIPSCPSNKQDAGVVRVFTVPDDPKRVAIWTDILSEENVKFVKGSRICYRHFDEAYIVKGGCFIGQDGIEREYKNINWRLTEDAIPSSELIESSINDKIILPRLPEKIFEVEKTCRTCSIEIDDEKDSTPLFSGSLSLQKFRPDIFKELEDFDLNIADNDGLPQQICQKCLQSFSILIQFRKQCQRVQIDLLKYFKNSKQQKHIRSCDAGVITLCDNYSDDEGAPITTPSTVLTNKTEDNVENGVDGEDDVAIDDDLLTDTEQNATDEDGNSEKWTCEYYIGADKNADPTKKNKLKRKGEKIEIVQKQKMEKKSPSKTVSIIVNHVPCLFETDQGDKKKERIRCKLCQRVTIYCCKNCPEEPRLCLEPCFPAFHESSRNKQEKSMHDLLRCRHCSRCFKSEVRMKAHVAKCWYRIKSERDEMKEGKKILKCKVCREQCNDDEAMENHMKEFHADGDLTPMCTICGRKFLSMKTLDAHLSRTHRLTEEVFKCDHCDRIYPSKLSLKEHVKRMHVKGIFECDICDETLTDAREFGIHKKGHLQRKNYKCQYCEKRFISNRKKCEHETTHTGEKPHLCELCGRSFPFKQGFIEHVKGHTGSTEFKCDICEKGFATKRKLYNHKLAHINGNYRLLNCKLCNQKYERENLIPSHMEIVHGVVEVNEDGEIPELPFECEICKTRFTSEEKLNKHVLLRHNPNKPYECEICGCRFRRKDAVAIHIARIHDRIKNYECEICQKKCFNLYALDDHLKSHSKEKPHQCPECPRSFKSVRGLQYHLRNHTMEIYSSV